MAFKNPFKRGPKPASAPVPSEQAAAVEEKHRTLSELAADIFSLVLTLRVNTDFGDPTETRQRIHRLFEVFENEAAKQGVTETAIADAKFAIVALLDEGILNSQWEGKDQWRIMSLQQELYKMNIAGEEFYRRLDKLRENIGANRDVAEVYFDCLSLGFEGRFKLFGREKLDALIADLSKELAAGKGWSMSSLSPRWRRPDDFSESVGEGVPVWVTALFFIPGAALLVVLFSLLARKNASATAEKLRELVQTIS
ncbi:MAG: DotU family type IV/VI secretion system protein [Candidatus Eisenbacteria bacterium]|uniref:DotU family type IV/VI secretion system protein n=1 Tax=Eiseniibacteriota bacterium TaxID=2212470 RepID=A0A7Y2E7U1_UNCEI|nr:DotU family type IV/VI secretion system protein [Candidatus Eisenbacteria bacterium]